MHDKILKFCNFFIKIYSEINIYKRITDYTKTHQFYLFPLIDKFSRLNNQTTPNLKLFSAVEDKCLVDKKTYR